MFSWECKLKQFNQSVTTYQITSPEVQKREVQLLTTQIEVIPKKAVLLVLLNTHRGSLMDQSEWGVGHTNNRQKLDLVNSPHLNLHTIFVLAKYLTYFIT